MTRGINGARHALVSLAGARSRGRRRRIAAALSGSALCAAALGASAQGAAAEVTAISFPGGPLTVSVGTQGQCQSSYASTGENFFPPTGNVGDCGFFLAFPATGNAPALQGTTWGFAGSAGPELSTVEHGYEYTPVEQSAVTGTGTEADPYSETTRFEVKETEAPETVDALVTETTTYVNGAPQFTSTYDVENKSGGTLYFRAMYAGDLFVNTSDFGVGIFAGGPPRFLGGQSTSSGVLGGFIEVSPAWSSWEEGCWNETALEGEGGRCTGAAATDSGIWHTVRTSVNSPEAFGKNLEPAEVDNAAGVEWDQYYSKTGLEAGRSAAFTIINRAQVPNGLLVSPATQTLTQGQTAAINVTATDTANTPYAGKALRYTITGSNPQTGSVTTNAQGVAQISYVGHNAGQDTVQMYLDLGGSGTQMPADPVGTATVTWTPPPPTPNSTYTIQSVKANPDGTITIVFVPTQNGTATVTVTVPTGTIAKKHKPKKCHKGTVRIKGKCRPKNTVTGTVQAKGTAGRPLTIAIAPSASVRAALRKGRPVPVTATLSYQSELGGAPVVQTYHVTLKPKKKPKHHKKRGKRKK